MSDAACFAIPGDLAAATGGYAYARRVLRALPKLRHLPLPDGFPLPSPDVLAIASARLAEIPAGTPLLIDGLAFGALPVSSLDAVRAPMVALVHHPLCLESALSAPVSEALRLSERASLSRATHVIATSAATAAYLSQVFGVPTARITVAEPGTDPAGQTRPGTGAPRLLAVGAIVPRKAYDQLVQTLASLDHLPWSLVIVGPLDRDPDAVRRLRALIETNGLDGRITLAGAVDAATLSRLYGSSDAFVIASLHEGYGMAAAEAMACGLPLVASTAGALDATIPDNAALKFAPGDLCGLREALRRMLSSPAHRAVCAAASWEAGQRLPRWEQTAHRIAEVLHGVRGSRGPGGSLR